MTVLRQGILEVTFDKDNIKSYLVEGGFADVTPDKITILAESSLNLTDINKSALLVELDSIEEKITNASDLDREILIERKSLMENFN
jgi:F-type H+-transporting ATPase subunit epsilon